MADMQPRRHHPQCHFLNFYALQVFQGALVPLLIKHLDPREVQLDFLLGLMMNFCDEFRFVHVTAASIGGSGHMTDHAQAQLGGHSGPSL